MSPTLVDARAAALDAFAAHQARVRAIPRRAVLADDRDCRDLVDTIKALVPA